MGVRDQITSEYVSWLGQLVDGDRQISQDYSRLLYRLYETDFQFTIPMDGNRAEDGIELRYHFGHDCNYSDNMVAALLDDRPCSVLEMMVALAIRCETHIMDDPEIGDRTHVWFWGMVNNLGLSEMTNQHYIEHHVDTVIAHFMERDYARDGSGGLFTAKHCPKDMRGMDIWYQMMWYLDEIV